MMPMDLQGLTCVDDVGLCFVLYGIDMHQAWYWLVSQPFIALLICDSANAPAPVPVPALVPLPHLLVHRIWFHRCSSNRDSEEKMKSVRHVRDLP